MPIRRKRDVIAQASSGTGKTATFAIGLLANIRPRSKETQALILSPTRELAEQSAKLMHCTNFYHFDGQAQLAENLAKRISCAPLARVSSWMKTISSPIRCASM